jgi:hypothetical protein
VGGMYLERSVLSEMKPCLLIDSCQVFGLYLCLCHQDASMIFVKFRVVIFEVLTSVVFHIINTVMSLCFLLDARQCFVGITTSNFSVQII